MTNPRRPIYWYQGLFLQPQHLQQTNLYNESLLTPLKNYLNSYFWGVCDLDIDKHALKELKFSLLQGEFLFRDGTWVAINHNACIEPRSFKGLWERFREPFKVYIAIKCLNTKGEQVDKLIQNDAIQGLPKARFILNSQDEKLEDLYNSGNLAQVDSLNYVLKLVWEGEIDFYPEYELFPIAKVEYNGQEAILSKEFSPPVVNLKTSKVLFTYLQNIKETLYSRSIILGGYKNLRKFLGEDYQPSASLKFLLALKTIAHYVPLMQHYIEAPNLSPWQLYGSLRQLIGELSIHSESIDALGITGNNEKLVPNYDHENLESCFRQLCILIDEVIGEIISSMESVIHLNRDGNYFKAQIPVNLLRDTNNFYLCIKSDLDHKELFKIINHTIKIGSVEDITILIKRALSGVPITYITEPPLGLFRRKNVSYFLLDHKSQSWLSVKEYANLCIFLNEIEPMLEIDLLILKGGDLLHEFN